MRQSNRLKSGLRFSKNAAIASRASGPRSIVPKCCASSAIRSATPTPPACFSSAFVTRSDAAGSAASFAACFAANASS